VRNESKNALVITDLTSISTIGFLSPNEDKSTKSNYLTSEQFASGEIYTSSMLDTLMCQSFYNPYITDILQQLILGSSAMNLSPYNIKKLEDKRVSFSSLYLLNILEELDKIGLKNLPKTMKYHDVLMYFIKSNHMIPIGLYRNYKDESKELNSNQSRKFVYMCPLKDTEVYIEYDKIYVLVSESYAKNKKDKTYLNNTKEITNLNNKNLKLIEKSNERSS
jgi:potassium large conductance calcium-activated channel subfamily M alpha protein 1